MILLLIEPLTAQFVGLHIPAEQHLFPLFTRNGWRPFGEQSRKIAAELVQKQIEETTREIAND